MWEVSAVTGVEGGIRFCTSSLVFTSTFLWVILALVFRERAARVESSIGKRASLPGIFDKTLSACVGMVEIFRGRLGQCKEC